MARSSGTQIARGPKEQPPRARQTSRTQASPLRKISPATRALALEPVSSPSCLHSPCRVWSVQGVHLELHQSHCRV